MMVISIGCRNGASAEGCRVRTDTPSGRPAGYDGFGVATEGIHLGSLAESAAVPRFANERGPRIGNRTGLFVRRMKNHILIGSAMAVWKS